MEKKNLKSNGFRILSNKFFIASIFFLIWIIFFDENSIVAHQKSKHQLNDLIQQKSYYKERIASDKQKLKDLNSGIEELEKFAREQYYMSKPDEDVFVIIDKN